MPFQILNTKVIFSAQVTTGYAVTGDLIFDRVDINIGGGFDGPGGVPYFFQLNPRGLVFLEGLKSGLYWNEGYIRMRVAVY